MPWVHASLRGQRVLARANDDGSLRGEGGRVEIRYKPNDGRAYQAAAGNLVVAPGAVLPDDACGPAEAAPSKKPADGKPARGAVSGGKGRPIPAHDSHGDGAIIAYADGGCSPNPGPGGLGVVVLDGKTRIEISEHIGEATNNIAELTAILRAAEASDPSRTLVVYTDSGYAIGVLGKGWKAKANTELVLHIRAKLKGRDVRFVQVPGHSGVPLNERADALAGEAVRSGRSRRERFESRG